MIADLIGRLHPALVHLPIGILLLGLCFELLTTSKRFAAIRPAIPAIIFWGMIAAVLSCITGLALNTGGDYEEELVSPHQWSGIALAVLSIILYALYRKNVKNSVIKLSSFITLILLFVTGHLGGTITHGEGFLSFSSEESAGAEPMKPIPNIQKAVVYTDIVQPLLQSRCYGCHGTRKQKGKLRLDDQQLILQGGESGEAVVPGKPDESEMIARILLPLEDDDHMPPPSKTQLTKEHIEILKWWVASGADFHKKVSELKQPPTLEPVLLALQSGTTIQSEEIEMVPKEPVAAADASLLAKANDPSLTVVPVARGSNYLEATLLNNPQHAYSLIAGILPFKQQLISLKLDGVSLKKEAIASISSLANLRKLNLSNTPITDEDIAQLANLKELRSLNLVGTDVSATGLAQLSKLQHLKYVYLYKTKISAEERESLEKMFASTTFDFGNYSLPMLEGDTSEIKF